ncbi:winged helix-turn-helix domain-containing protein [Flavisphingomonas formosensis]|uniref:winged helix-turn-helix domain-containing protein n=1 Tax=Flavisphingomonas formosensis TaxID=861534 RepID=UPI0012FC127F|nr:LysR family transcriptional regulator [Sphingomonas formosensis]
MARPAGPLKLKAQLFCGDEIAMGPGKAALLDAIIREGSISAAGRALGMSYRRTWMLVDVMNRSWIEPLVETEVGGRRGGGARVTDTGRAVLAAYQALMDRIGAAADAELATLAGLLRSTPLPPHPSALDES